MRDTPRIAFLLVVDAFAVAFLVMLLNGCGTMPSRYMDRNGDFVSHIASSAAATDQQRG
jgi:hypothetical protein